MPTESVIPPQLLSRRPSPNSRVEKAWSTYGWRPQKGILTHFNAGIGYNVLTNRRYPFYGCFGHILELNESTGEALVHIPKPLMNQGSDEYFIVPFWDLLPAEVVSGFDVAAYFVKRPPISCPRLPIWNVNPME